MQQTQILFSKLRGGNQMNTGAFIHDLLDWIDNNLDSRLDIETVARRAGYSKWHLQRIFKEHTGYPLGEYIRVQKLQKSVERLAHSDEPILNVAIALGLPMKKRAAGAAGCQSRLYLGAACKARACAYSLSKGARRD